MRTICLLLGGISAVLAGPATINSPEVDSSTAISAVTLIGGAFLVLRSRYRR